MKQIFVNLKRFDVPRNLGGICTMDNPKEWIEWVICESIQLGLGKLVDIRISFLLPEALILSAVEKLSHYRLEETAAISIGCQGVYRDDVKPGGNFGAFTTNRPAAAIKNLGCTWSIIGHSEERKDKLDIISRYDPYIMFEEHAAARAKNTVDGLINDEVMCALSAGINVLLCVGETTEDKGDGDFEQQKPRIEDVLERQLINGLKGLEHRADKRNGLCKREIVIGYEPIWAIGPGKIPPGEEYISFVSSYIKSLVRNKYNFDPIVVYGGGLKEENAGMISRIESIGGGLVALTKFTGEIAFEPEGLKKILIKFTED